MDNPFDSPRMLIQEAEENIASVEQAVEAFLGKENWRYATEVDRKTGHKLVYVQFSTDIPKKVSLQIRAVARDLRDALDHAVYASSVAIYGGDPQRTKFLAADTSENIQHDIKRGRCKDVHDEIVALMVRENASKTGNRPIWALNQLRNSNTHKVVSLAQAESGGLGLHSGSITATTLSEWRSTSRRLYFVRVEAAEGEFKIHPRMEIRLHKAFGLGDIPASSCAERDLLAVLL